MTRALAFDPVVPSKPLIPSVYGPPPPAMRSSDLPGLVSLKVRDLFPDIDEAVYNGGADTSAIRQAAIKVLAGVDMSMIGTKDRVNILCSEHGFAMAGGHAYAEMLHTIKDVIIERTGCTGVRLLVIAWLGNKEGPEMIEYFSLDKRFDGKVRTATPSDQGIPIETAMGTMYGLKKVYDADWIIHAHYDDPREVYLHRAIDRITKPFGMSYARMETRSIFHMMMGPRSGNFIGRAIADSPFVRGKLAFTTTLVSSPDGIVSVDADNDLDAIGHRMTANILRSYGKMLALFRAIDECVVVLDGAKWPYYIHGGGMIFGHLFFNGQDWFDLELVDSSVIIENVIGSAVSTGIRAIVLNHCLIGLSVFSLPLMYPLIVANEEMAETMRRDFANPGFMDSSETATNLVEAVEMAKEQGDSDKIICFDGSYGSINLSPSMAEYLLELAPECGRVVEEELLPRWLKQRGIDPDGIPVR
jgi:hypothetical protein